MNRYEQVWKRWFERKSEKEGSRKLEKESVKSMNKYDKYYYFVLLPKKDIFP